MTDDEIVQMITEVANEVRDDKGYAVHIKESDTSDIIQAIRFVNKIKEEIEKVKNVLNKGVYNGQ